MGSSSHSSGNSLRAFDIAMIVTSTLAVALRFWSRALPRASIHARFWWDDWMIVVALLFSTASLALQTRAVGLGLGNHIGTLPPQGVKQLLKVLWISYYMSDLGIALAKASCLFFYARTFTTQNRWFRYGLWLGQTLNFLWWLSAVARCLLFCDPVDKYWNVDKPGFCRSADALYIGSAVPSTVIDVFVLLLPLPMIARLSMKLSRKALVAGVFICGYLVVAISLGRLITSLTSGDLLNEDITYYGVTLLIWVAAEPPVSIIGCCLPINFYLARQCIEKGPLSLSAMKSLSKSKSALGLKWPTSRDYHRQPSEHSIELAQGDFTTTAPSVRYAVSATKTSANDGDTNLSDDSEAPAIKIRKDIDIRSHNGM